MCVSVYAPPRVDGQRFLLFVALALDGLASVPAATQARQREATVRRMPLGDLVLLERVRLDVKGDLQTYGTGQGT